jgi:hypothetical protein
MNNAIQPQPKMERFKERSAIDGKLRQVKRCSSMAIVTPNQERLSPWLPA